MCQAQNATSACVKATPRSHLKLHRSDFGCTARWSHQLISNWGIPAVAAKWHGKNDEMHRPTVAAIGCTKEKLETVNGLDQVERAVVTRPAPGHPLGPQAGQEVLKDLERVGSTKGPSRTRIPQRSPKGKKPTSKVHGSTRSKMLLCVGTSQNGTNANGWMCKHATNKPPTRHCINLAMTSLLFRLLGFGNMFVDRHRTGVVSF